MNVRNRKVYVKKDTDYIDDFWNKHSIWAFDFYITKKWHYYEYFNLTNLNIPKSSLCYICQREIKYEIFYLTDHYKQVSIGKCCIKRYNKQYNTQYNKQYNKKYKHIKRFKLKEE